MTMTVEREVDGQLRDKWLDAAAKSHATWKMANTLLKALAKRYSDRWQFVDFLGPNGRESAGVVDIFAIRKSGRKPLTPGLKALDLFEIQLIQVKGGSAKWPTAQEISRLRLVRQQYDAKEIILFHWRRAECAEFYKLDENDDAWEQSTAAKLFG